MRSISSSAQVSFIFVTLSSIPRNGAFSSESRSAGSNKKENRKSKANSSAPATMETVFFGNAAGVKSQRKKLFHY